MLSSCSQDLLEAIKPVLEEEQLQDAADSLFMESDSYDAKILYHAMKVWEESYNNLLLIISRVGTNVIK